MPVMSNVVGWDIGGAHVKAAVINQAGEVIAVFQQACSLWKGLDQLKNAVHAILELLDGAHDLHAVTMTGELVDLFENRDDGVKQIIHAMQTLLTRREILFFAGKLGFLEFNAVEPKDFLDIASANWLASASYAAQRINNALFVDIGSTTTDILALRQGRVDAAGYTDYHRLISQELVYTGIVRTAVMAVSQTAQDEGQEIGIMAEYFATMADVYRVTGELNELYDQSDTADGAEKTLIASARRLSRMVGSDFFVEELPRWQRFAENIKAQQLHKIQRSCEIVMSRHELEPPTTVVGAGTGRFLVKQLAKNLASPYLDFSDLVPDVTAETSLTAADCAPAVAVACLAKKAKQIKIKK
jgi:(4-(4-[2-(gamma-L-glutamylamino)ethyl]phenoxymethyl)furan-2-yl)methanamine synthase